jgi:hypothetical protein
VFLCDFLKRSKLSLDPKDLSPELVRLLTTRVQATGVSPFTTRGLVQVIKGFYTWLEREGYLRESPKTGPGSGLFFLKGGLGEEWIE